MRTSSSSIAILSLGLVACGSDNLPPAPAPAPAPDSDSVLRPSPGADIDLPPAAPERGRRTSRAGAGDPIDLGKDRQIAKVRVPASGRGAAMTFTFPDANGGED